MIKGQLVRIGLVGPSAVDRFADNIADALQHTGHIAIQLGPAAARGHTRLTTNVARVARLGWHPLEERAQRKIVRAAHDAGCEVVIALDAALAPDAVDRIRRSGTRMVFWFPDHVANLGRQFMLLGSYDAVFFKEPQLVERLRATLDLPVYYLPQACNPRLHKPLVPAGTEPYLVIAGNMYPSRIRLLERLLAKGIPLKLYGAGFPHWIGKTAARSAHTGRSVFGEEKARVFRSAVGVLNTMHPAEEAGVNSRVFEAAGCGAAILSEFRRTVPELFAVGDEILTFRDFDELIDQATRLLNDSGMSARVGDAAARRAHLEHTYDHRIAAILEKVM
jgi:spore maturation protein CgeB